MARAARERSRDRDEAESRRRSTARRSRRTDAPTGAGARAEPAGHAGQGDRCRSRRADASCATLQSSRSRWCSGDVRSSQVAVAGCTSTRARDADRRLALVAARMTDLDVHLARDRRRRRRRVRPRGSRAPSRPCATRCASFAAVVDVEAVLQESLLRVWQVAPRFDADGGPNGLLRLAIRIARNLAVSELRRTRTRRRSRTDRGARGRRRGASPIRCCAQAIARLPRQAPREAAPGARRAARSAGGRTTPTLAAGARHAAQHVPAELHARAPAARGLPGQARTSSTRSSAVTRTRTMLIERSPARIGRLRPTSCATTRRGTTSTPRTAAARVRARPCAATVSRRRSIRMVCRRRRAPCSRGSGAETS